MSTEQANQIVQSVDTPVPHSVELQQQLQQLVRASTGGWLSFTIPISAFDPNKMKAVETFFSLEALTKSGLGSPAAALYTFMVAVGHSLESGTGWSKGGRKSQPKAKRQRTDGKEEAVEEPEPVETPRFPADIAFEIVISKYKNVVGLRIHVIPKAGQVVSEVQDAAFKQCLREVISQLLENNRSFTGRNKNFKASGYDGDAFRYQFKNLEMFMNAYTKFASTRLDAETDIADILSLEQDLANSRSEACLPQSDPKNYKNLDGPVFPFPSLVTRFDSKSIGPADLTCPTLLFRMEAQVALNDFPLDPRRAMGAEEVERVKELAAQKKAAARVGRCGLDGSTASPTKDERLAAISIVEHSRRERLQSRELYKNDEVESVKAERELAEAYIERLLNIDSDSEFHNEAFSGVAKHLRRVGDVFHGGVLAVADDLPPFANFMAVLGGCVSDLWGGTPGDKQQMVFSTFFGALTAFDVTNRTQNLILQHLGEAGTGKSFSVELAAKLIPPGVVQAFGGESKHANTMHSHDRDGTTSLFDEFPKEMLDSVNFPERARFFRIGVTSGMMEIARAICSDEKRGKELVTVAMSIFMVILTNEPIPPNDAMQSRVSNMEFDRRGRASRRDVLRNALSQAAELEENDQSFMIMRTIFCVAALYLLAQSAGFLPPVPNRILCDTLLYIDHEMSKHHKVPPSAVRTPLRVKMMANTMAVVRGVVTVLASPLQRTLFADARNKSMFGLLKVVQEQIFMSVQVTMAVISLFDRTIISEEQAIVRRALQGVPGIIKVSQYVPRKYFESVDTLVEALNETTGIDRERLKSIIKELREETVKLKVNGCLRIVPFLSIEKIEGKQQPSILDVNFLRVCSAVRGAMEAFYSSSAAAETSAVVAHCQQHNNSEKNSWIVRQEQLIELVAQQMGEPDVVARKGLDLLQSHHVIWQNQGGDVGLAHDVLHVEVVSEEHRKECKSPVELTLEVFSTRRVFPRPVLLTTNVIVKTQNERTIVCPQLATVYLQSGRNVLPSYSVTHRSKYGNFLKTMTGASFKNVEGRKCDGGYTEDPDLYAMDDAVKSYGISARYEHFPPSLTKMCAEARKSESIFTGADDIFCQEGEYPRKLAEEHVKEVLDEDARWNACGSVGEALAEDGLLDIYKTHGVILDSIDQLQRDVPDQDTRLLDLTAAPTADDGGASSSTQIE